MAMSRASAAVHLAQVCIAHVGAEVRQLSMPSKASGLNEVGQSLSQALNIKLESCKALRALGSWQKCPEYHALPRQHPKLPTLPDPMLWEWSRPSSSTCRGQCQRLRNACHDEQGQICARASPKPTAIATWRLMKLLALASLGITGAQHGTMHCHGKPLEMTMRWLRAWIG